MADENGKKSGVGRNGLPPPKEHQFKPGNKGGGRPKGRRSISTVLKHMLENPDSLPESVRKKYREQFGNIDGYGAIAVAMIKDALAAKDGGTRTKSREQIMDRTEGKVKQDIGVGMASPMQDLLDSIDGQTRTILCDGDKE